MSFKVEIVKIPNSNSNQVSSYNETVLNGKTSHTMHREFIVPEENTDKFVKEIKNSEKNKLISVGLTAFFGTCLAFFGGYKFLSKKNFIDCSLLGVASLLAGGLLSIIPAGIINSRQNNLLKELNAQEIKQ